MDARTLRTATWTEADIPDLQDGYAIWISPDVPGVARVAKDGRLFFRFKGVNYTDVQDVVSAYNKVVPPALQEGAVRAAIAAQLGVAPDAVPDDGVLWTGMRRALAAYLAVTS